MPKTNPNFPAPKEVLSEIAIAKVSYRDFDGVLRVGSIEVHKQLVDDVALFFAEALKHNFLIHEVVRSSDEPYLWDDDKLIAANVTSGFNYRLIKGTNRPSLHGLGCAFDVNPRLNPYIGYKNGRPKVEPIGATYEPGKQGVLDGGHPLVQLMKDRGWEWGGDWTPESGRVDYQHFQKRLET